MRGFTSFAAAGLLSCGTMAVAGDGIIINELDADTPGTDTMEFVELYDGALGGTSLDGYVVVFYNGSNDTSYNAFDLDGFATDPNGYFLLGNEDVPGVDIIFPSNGLQNGADGVAVYFGSAEDFPNGTPVTNANLVDAIVYGTNDPDAVGLITVLLNPDQPQVNESANGDSSGESNQRCPNGSGGARNTDTYAQFAPTPKADNFCPLPFGACCDEITGICIDSVSLEECEASGGRYGGDGSECATLDPPCAPLGACCDEIIGACADGVSQAECEAAGNRYGGDGSDCATIDPPCEASVLPANLMISEVVDGTVFSQPKYAEITNCSAETVDLSLYSFGNFNNGSTDLGGGAATQLIGTLGPGEVFVYLYDAEPEPPAISTYEDIYGFPPDQYAGGGFINGDDVLALFFGQAVDDGSNATLVDVYGVIGVDGTGEAWEYTDGYSYRNPGNVATDTFDEIQWFFGGVNSLEDPGGDDEVERELILTFTTPGVHDCAGALLISEIVDGTLPGGQPKWAEVTNCGDSDLDLSQFSIGNYNNGGTDLGGNASAALLGILPVGQSYVYAYEAAPEPPAISSFEDVYGFPPDQFAGGGFVNGDDVIALFFGQATGDGSDALMVDVYGVIGEDGSGTVWEYTDGYSRRTRGQGPNPAFAPAEWFIAGANALETGDDEEERELLQTLTYPGVHACQETCIYDIDGSGDVGFGDLLYILSNWGAPGGPGDLDGNGDVGYQDLLLVLSYWGPC